MKFVFLVLILFSFNLNANLIEKVIYGADNRKDVLETTNGLHKKLADSTLAMFSLEELEDDGNAMKVVAGTLEERGKCSDIRFAKQVAAAECSAFLVADQYILTAGHCIDTINDCQKFVWLFGFENRTEIKTAYSIPKTEIYKCIEITERQATYNDYALIKLDRPVVGHEPLKYRTEGKIADDASLVVIGHPTGLPTKIADGAKVRTNEEPWFFQANLDTFSGNSGSAVFDANTGLVEGILVRGEQDYEDDEANSCQRPFVCKDNECRGEDVIRVTNVATLMNLAKQSKN